MVKYRTLDDTQLLLFLQAGDHHAFTEIYDRYFSRLYIHAYNRLRERDEAKDIVQELFSTLWLKRNTLNLQKQLSTYLYTSVRNRILDVITHKQIKYKYVLSQGRIDEGYSITDHRLRERQLAAIIALEVQAFPLKMREVFELSREENLSHKEIAERLSISEQTVRSHIKHALRILRVKLGLISFLYFILFTKI